MQKKDTWLTSERTRVALQTCIQHNFEGRREIPGKGNNDRKIHSTEDVLHYIPGRAWKVVGSTFGSGFLRSQGKERRKTGDEVCRRSKALGFEGKKTKREE